MKHIKKIAPVLLLCSGALFAGASTANDLSSGTQQEITHLFAYLKSSGCQFNRNGSWYSAQDAADHLNDKYQYLLGKNRISSTEEFIAAAASQSSMSGQPYLVKCGNAAPVESANWFYAELEKYRKSVMKVSGKP